MKKIVIITILLFLLSGCSVKENKVKKSINSLIDELFIDYSELTPFKDKLEISNVKVYEDSIEFDLSSVDINSVLGGEEGDNFFEEGDLNSLLQKSESKIYHIELQYEVNNGKYLVTPTYELLNAIFANALSTHDEIMEGLIDEALKNN